MYSQANLKVVSGGCWLLVGEIAQKELYGAALKTSWDFFFLARRLLQSPIVCVADMDLSPNTCLLPTKW